MSRAREEIVRDIAREEGRRAGLERSLETARARIASLLAELEASADSAPAPIDSRLVSNAALPQSPEEKVRLFRALFRGRPDVFPTRFVSQRSQKPGYAPACANKWEPGLCILKTGGKCTDCAHQAFLAVDDRVVLDHLKGRHVIGVYPLLVDETCWFLAADFDKGSWREDVAALTDTCRALDVPVAIERSRSGNGAHAWFFFSAPVPANVARRMGCYLITETMSRRHELSMDSYDRLFPNQDTMPRGGFGNLIALPLQFEPRKQGNSVFLDERFLPYSDQWKFLASIVRIEPHTADSIAREATRTGQVVGVKFAEDVDPEEAAAPWTKRPSRRAATKRITAPLPATVKVVLAQRLFVEKEGLPSQLLNQIKRLAAFLNPEFYKKQRMRLSTAQTPRIIACAEDLERFVALPRGCIEKIEKLLAGHEIRLDVEDKRSVGASIEFKFNGQLTLPQESATKALLSHDIGVFVAPPGLGKTVLGAYLIAQRARSTLILVHRKPLLEQWVAQLAMFLGIDEKDVGQIGGGKRKPNGRLDVAMIQSLVRKDDVEDMVAEYGHVIVDECHHLAAVSYERVLSEVKARYVLGLTATPQRRDGHQPIIGMQLGPVRITIDAKRQAAFHAFEQKLVVRETPFRLTPSADSEVSIQELYRSLANDEARNRRIVDDVIAVLREGRSPIVLTERKDHLDYLVEALRPAVRNVVVLKGGLSARERRGSAERLASIPETAERVVLATGRYIGEGFDDARLDTLFLALPISWKGTLIQYSGRLHRHRAAKTEVRIYDYVDRDVPMLLRMFEKRLSTYRAIGYARGEAPLGFEEPPEARTIEYEEFVRGPEPDM